MLEYPVGEAVELLQRNLASAKSSLQQVEADIDFLKDQCTTIEVGILFCRRCITSTCIDWAVRGGVPQTGLQSGIP